jgi:phosphatidylglycerophosphate synthase
METILFFTIKRELNLVSLVLFIIAILTDMYDGALARRLHAESRFGQNLDAVSDGWLVAWTWLGFVMSGTISLFAWCLGFAYMIVTYILELTIVKRFPCWGARVIYLRPFTYAGLLMLTPLILALRIENLSTKVVIISVLAAVSLVCASRKKDRVRYFVSLLISDYSHRE